jgi:hypothetical protein
MGLTMNEDDKNAFLSDFKKADLNKKLDMWYYALEQEGMWEEILSEMAAIAEEQQMGHVLEKMKQSKNID